MPEVVLVLCRRGLRIGSGFLVFPFLSPAGFRRIWPDFFAPAVIRG